MFLTLTSLLFHLNKRFIIPGILIILNSSILYGQCPGNLIANGSFTSVEGEGVVAPGWIGGPQGPITFGTPDINDAIGPVNTTPGYNWNGQPLPSMDGGTWQNLYSSEYVEQTIQLVQGAVYRLCFEFATQSISGASIPSVTSIFINGNLTFNSLADTSIWSWEDTCLWFIAPVNSVTVRIGGSYSNSYLAVDGVCLTISGTGANDNSDWQHLIGHPIIDGYNHTFEIPYIFIQGSDIEIYDLTGKLCLQQQIANKFSFNFSDWQKGVYFYRISKGNNSYHSGKFIKL